MSGYYRVQSQPVKFSIFSINTKHKQAKFIYIYHSNIPFAFDFGTYSSPFYILLKMYGSSKIVEGTTSFWILSDYGSRREQVPLYFKRCDNIME